MNLPSKGIPEIPENIIQQVLSEVGFPVVTFEDLKITEQDVDNLFIYPAMQKYFAYNPIKTRTSYNLQPNVKVEIPFLDDYTFGVLSARVSTLSASNQAPHGKFNFFEDHWRRVQGGGNVYDNPYYTRAVKLSEQAANMSYISLSKAGSMEIDHKNRVLKGHSNIGGELVVTWAKCSHKWADVRFEHEFDVIDLAKAYALRYFGMLRLQIDANTGVTMNGDSFITRADNIEEKINEKWGSKPKVLVMR